MNFEQFLSDPLHYANNISTTVLVEYLQKISDAYHNTANPHINDIVYDELIEILKSKDKSNPFLKKVGHSSDKNKTKLPFEMGSLTKIKNDDGDLKKWLKKYKGPYFISDKEDGVSAQLYKNKKGETILYTRGDGEYGQDISHLIKYLVNDKIIKKIPNGTSIRGEIIISRKEFEKISDEMKNPRNVAISVVVSKNVNTKIAKQCEFIAYAIIEPRYHMEKQYELMKEYGFHVVEYKKRKELSLEDLTSILTDRRKNSDYDIDGLVVVDDSKIYEHAGGYPNHAFAFKMVMEDQIATATVKKVIWNLSKDGYIKPKIEIEPIDLAGITIKFLTAFSAKYIVDNRIGKGAKVRIIRSGDVIPYIMAVLEKANAPDMPTVNYKWNESKVDIIIDNSDDEENDDIAVKVLSHFFEKIKVKYLGEGVITKLVDAGYNTIEKILKAKQKDLYNIEGLGEKMITKIYENIDDSFEDMTLENFMAGSNLLGRNLGEGKIKEVVKMYPNIISSFKKLSEEEIYEKIMEVDGFSEKLARKFSENFPKFMEFYKKIDKVKDLSRFKQKKTININNEINEDIKDKTFVFTGFRDAELEKYIEDNGGKVSGSVSKNTYLVVYKVDDNSGKIKKAKDIGVRTMSKESFLLAFKK